MTTSTGSSASTIPTFRQLRDAIVAAKPDATFPYGIALNAERLKQIRSAPHLQTLLQEIRASARKAQNEPTPALPYSLWRLFDANGSRGEYETPYFARRGRLLSLVMASLIDETDEYLPALQDTVWSICDEYTWCVPAHPDRSNRLPPEEMIDLFAAETSHALAETLTLLGSRLEKPVAERARREVERRVFRSLFDNAVRFHWESSPMNWSAVCAGSAGMAALLLETNRQRLAGMLDRCCRAMECFLEGYAADGGCAEGIGYWQYGFGYYVYFAEMLRAFTGSIDLLQGEKIQRIAAFPSSVNLSSGAYVNYSDGVMRTEMATGLLCRLAARTGAPLPETDRVPRYAFDHCFRWPHTTGNLFWTDPSLLDQPAPAGTIVFGDLGWVIDRRRLRGTPVAFSARAGHNAEPHNQNDLGHFILHVGDENLLVDLGAGEYTRQYFGAERYSIIHNSSEGHSVPFIDGQAQQPGRQFESKVLRCQPRTDGMDFAVDLARAYALPSLKKLERAFAWSFSDTTARLVLTDRFEFDAAPGALQEIFMSLREPLIEPGRVTWRGQKGAVRMSFEPAKFTPAVEAIHTRDHDREPVVAHRLRLTGVQPSARMEFVFTFDVVL